MERGEHAFIEATDERIPKGLDTKSIDCRRGNRKRLALRHFRRRVNRMRKRGLMSLVVDGPLHLMMIKKYNVFECLSAFSLPHFSLVLHRHS